MSDLREMIQRLKQDHIRLYPSTLVNQKVMKPRYLVITFEQIIQWTCVTYLHILRVYVHL